MIFVLEEKRGENWVLLFATSAPSEEEAAPALWAWAKRNGSGDPNADTTEFRPLRIRHLRSVARAYRTDEYGVLADTPPEIVELRGDDIITLHTNTEDSQ